MSRARQLKTVRNKTLVLIRPAVNVLILALAVGGGQAGSLEFRHQTISIPTQPKAWSAWQMTLFADVDNDGRDDLLAIGPAENKLWIYRQQPSGFSPAPDQTIELPASTVWVTPCEVDEHPGVELLISSATGLVYLPQNGGVFTKQFSLLANCNQIFSNTGLPILIRPALLKNGTNDVIPAIFEANVVLYKKNSAFQWSPAENLPLRSRSTDWAVDRGGWTVGLQPSYAMHISQSFLANPVDSTGNPEKRPENNSIGKIFREMARDDAGQPQFDVVDIDGDGQEDLVLWQVAGNLDPKTDLFVFLRGAGHRLPEKPTQILHCRGFPIPVGPLQKLSPMCDLDGDRICELVLVTLKKSLASSSSLVEMALSQGIDWTMTIRTWKQGIFSNSQDGFLNLTTMLPGEMGAQPLFLVDGDFNGDGRRDVLARHTANQWDIVVSSARGDWFVSEPAITMELPSEGFFEIRDLNCDGLSDLIMRDSNEPKLAVFLSRLAREKARER